MSLKVLTFDLGDTPASRDTDRWDSPARGGIAYPLVGQASETVLKTLGDCEIVTRYRCTFATLNTDGARLPRGNCGRTLVGAGFDTAAHLELIRPRAL